MKPLVWRIGGPQGSGIDRAALLFSKLCAKHGLHVLARREYHSNITGRHSYSDVRISEEPIYSYSSKPQLLLCLDAESLCRHIKNVPENGWVLYDVRVENKTFEQLKLLDESIHTQLIHDLQHAKLTDDLGGLLEYASLSGVNLLPIDFGAFFATLRSELTITKTAAERSHNVIGVAISAALLKLDLDILHAEIEQLFSHKPGVIALNIKAASLGYAYGQTLSDSMDYALSARPTLKDKRIWINGVQSVALGKLAAGLGIQTYYPISPATDESSYLESHIAVPLSNGSQVGPVIFQTEDELAAITMACGAALTGARAATSTSGPGFSLMAEGLGWAGMNEVPVVISLYQRGGPSTGMPTRTEQGDLQFVIHAGHGEFPRMVLASGDIEECFYDAFRAFNYAERFQMPVIHMLDKNLASSSQTIRAFNTEDLALDRGDILLPSEDNQRVARFELTDDGISPRPLLGQAKQTFWSTGVEHSEIGQVSENTLVRKKMLEKRSAKLAKALSEIPLEEKLAVYGDKQAKLVIVSWGSNKGGILEAIECLAEEGISLCVIMVKLLWPFPSEEISELIPDGATLIALECNQTGQFCQLFEGNTGLKMNHLILKYTGRPFVIEEIMHSLRQIVSGTAEKILVHQNLYE